MMPRSVVVLVALVAWSACGESNSPGPEELDPEAAAEACNSYCTATAVDCSDPDIEPNPEGIEYCMEYCLELASWIRGDALSCLALLDCDGEETRACSDKNEPLDVLDEYEAVCIRRLPECFPDEPELEFEVDCICHPDTGGNLISLASPETMDAFMACFEGPCEEFTQCFRSVFPNGSEDVFWCLYQ